ncbi:MAG: class I SAM-dependent methyltransferase [Cyclobacteriaceae bacterium]
MIIIKLILLFPYYLSRVKHYFGQATKEGLVGKHFFTYGHSLAWRLLLKGKLSLKLFLNPVSIVRYFEFDFTERHLGPKRDIKVLDISSPYLMSFYVIDNFQNKVDYINPDKKDLADVIAKSKALGIDAHTFDFDAANLPFEDQSYDVIYSISVIEHINDDKDTDVLRELWRVLKPNGKLILTFPSRKEFEEEYRNTDAYGLQEGKKEKYFFQRFYDEASVANRILSALDHHRIESYEFFGETTESFYSDYHERWTKNGLAETIKDPLYIVSNFKKFNNSSDFPGVGIIGLSIIKEQ